MGKGRQRLAAAEAAIDRLEAQLGGLREIVEGLTRKVCPETPLPPCPMCGGASHLQNAQKGVLRVYWVVCEDCGTGSRASENKDEVEKAWRVREGREVRCG